ncbi:hypothetical protein LPW11_06095 [Geomonas sp. RF6]|uniref:hypothetical protein n=1 Tax=Geomonas sp. RF6 TaxID=2897342 RepID=UPI001E3F5932|nr:hypothetical protein [Geomonas sp. RF6]UFS71761.1 hypothetical protein LPW11_06095 [Geomonas sp. RF6]
MNDLKIFLLVIGVTTLVGAGFAIPQFHQKYKEKKASELNEQQQRDYYEKVRGSARVGFDGKVYIPYDPYAPVRFGTPPPK